MPDENDIDDNNYDIFFQIDNTNSRVDIPEHTDPQKRSVIA
jgi:hypothetical protein